MRVEITGYLGRALTVGRIGQADRDQRDRGKLGAEEAALKSSGVTVRRHTRRAQVFDEKESALDTILGSSIVAGDVAMRYVGPRVGTGMREMLAPTSVIAGAGLIADVVLITDDRSRAATASSLGLSRTQASRGSQLVVEGRSYCMRQDEDAGPTRALISVDEEPWRTHMKIPILIEATENQRFRATGGGPFASSVEADTPKAALDELKNWIIARVERGGRIEVVDVPDGSNPWQEGFGMFRDDPLYDDWQEAISDNRRITDDTAEGA